MRGATCFTGIGAPEQAMPCVDWVWGSEIEAFPISVMKARHPDSDNLGDILAPDFIDRALAHGPLDIMVGGPPCQAFSVAGLRNSLSDPRGNLSLRWVQVLHAIRPRNAITENVPGWLSTSDNAFGCFLGAVVGADDALRSPLERGRWPDAGMASGPRARLAWRILDAQYFGLAQRRRRVFVVIDFGEGADPAAVLFERHSLSGHPAPRREKGPSVAALTANGVGTCGADDNQGQAGHPVPAGIGHDNETARSLTASHTATGRLDANEQTFVCSSLDASYGRLQGCSGQDMNHGHSHLVPMTAHSLRGEGFDASEDGTGRRTPLVPVAYQTSGNCGAWKTGDITGALDTNTDPNSHVIAFSAKDHGADAMDDCSPTLRAGGHSGSHANAGVMPAVAFTASEQANSYAWERDVYPTLNAQIPNDSSNIQQGIRLGSAVRRLTPVECERLQGFPDDYTAVPYRGKPAADGPRYKALGNSMAVPVMAWIGQRIQMVEDLLAKEVAA